MGNRWSSASVAVTAMTLGSAAGKSGGDFGPALPAAAIRMAPFCRALAIARAIRGSDGPAKLILTTRAPLDVAQSNPLTMLNVVPSAPLGATPTARTARI